MTSALRGCWVLCTCCLLASCAGAGFTPRHVFDDAKALLSQHAAPRAGLVAIQAEARVDQRGDQGRVRGTVLMFVERAGRVRFDVMTQFGPVLTLTSDGDHFALSDMRQKKFTYGPACEANIARLLGMPVTARQAASLLLGGAPELPGMAPDDPRVSREIAWQSESGRYLVTRRGGGLVARLELELFEADRDQPLASQRFRLRASALIGDNGFVYWQAEYDDYRSVKGPGGTFDVPFRVRVMQPGSETDTLVRFKEIIANPDIPDGAFVQAPPPGVQSEESPCD